MLETNLEIIRGHLVSLCDLAVLGVLTVRVPWPFPATRMPSRVRLLLKCLLSLD